MGGKKVRFVHERSELMLKFRHHENGKNYGNTELKFWLLFLAVDISLLFRLDTSSEKRKTKISRSDFVTSAMTSRECKLIVEIRRKNIEIPTIVCLSSSCFLESQKNAPSAEENGMIRNCRESIAAQAIDEL
jgi:hypothetical protein